MLGGKNSASIVEKNRFWSQPRTQTHFFTSRVSPWFGLPIIAIHKHATMLPFIYNEKRTVTLDKAQKILSKNGINLSADEAEMLLEFLYKLCNLSVSEAINHAKKRKQALIADQQKIKPKRMKS